MKVIICTLILTGLLQAEPLYMADTFKQWPSISLQYNFIPAPKPVFNFPEADFAAIESEVYQSRMPMIPDTKRRQFSKLVSINNPKINWRVTMSAFAGSHVSGFSQSIGMSTMLVKDELYLDADVTHVKYNFKDKYLNSYYGDGDKYRVDTTLHWYPTDNFSMHLGIGGFFDK